MSTKPTPKLAASASTDAASITPEAVQTATPVQTAKKVQTPVTAKTQATKPPATTAKTTSKSTAFKPAVKKSKATATVKAKAVTAKEGQVKAALAKPDLAKPGLAKPGASKTVRTAKVTPSVPSKTKMERDSFTMPKDEYAQIAALKKRLENLARPTKKSELLRAGLKVLSALDDTTLLNSLNSLAAIKTGRPKH